MEDGDSSGAKETAVGVGATDDVSRLQEVSSGTRKINKWRIRTHSLLLGKMETAELYRGLFRGWLIH